MSPMTAGIVLSTIALLVQGTRCLIRQGAPPFVRRFGALTLLLAAGLSAVLFGLLHFGEAVLSPEFDAVVARGHRRSLASLVLGLAFAAGLGWHVQGPAPAGRGRCRPPARPTTAGRAPWGARADRTVRRPVGVTAGRRPCTC